MVALSTQVTYLVIVSCIANFFAAAPWTILYVYTPEVYPTVVRATGYGVASAFARFGGSLAPIVGEMAFTSSASAPFIINSIAMLLAGLVSFALPIETVGKSLSDDIGEDLTKDNQHDTLQGGPHQHEDDHNHAEHEVPANGEYKYTRASQQQE